MDNAPLQKKSPTITDQARKLGSNILNPIGLWLYQHGVHPDTVTMVGLLLVAVAALAIGGGALQIGGAILLVALPFDALDGAVARAMKRQDQFGAVLDSVLDRYADGFIFAALSYHFAVQDQPEMMFLSLMALLGSLLVSYVRARADGVALETKTGWFTRLERVCVILVMLLVPPLLPLGVILLAIGTHVTVLQRLWYVYSALRNEGE